MGDCPIGLFNSDGWYGHEPADRSLRQEVLRLQRKQARQASARPGAAEKAGAVASIARDIFKLFGGKPWARGMDSTGWTCSGPDTSMATPDCRGPVRDLY